MPRVSPAMWSRRIARCGKVGAPNPNPQLPHSCELFGVFTSGNHRRHRRIFQTPGQRHAAISMPAGTSLLAIRSTSFNFASRFGSFHLFRTSPTAKVAPGLYLPLRNPLASGTRARTPRSKLAPAVPNTLGFPASGRRSSRLKITCKAETLNSADCPACTQVPLAPIAPLPIELPMNRTFPSFTSLASTSRTGWIGKLAVPHTVILQQIDEIRLQCRQRAFHLHLNILRRPLIGALKRPMEFVPEFGGDDPVFTIMLYRFTNERF